MQRIIIIRHAPTDANHSGIFMGHHDAVCSESGLSAAHVLGRSMKLSKDFRLFTSPLARSKATLDSISPKGRKIVDARLIERALGKWEGCSETTVRREYPDAFEANDNLDPLFTPPGGEQADSFASRICDFLVDISNPRDQSTALVVTHNGVIAVMRSLIEEKPLRKCFADAEPFLEPRTYNYYGSRLPDYLPKMLEALHGKK